MAKKKRSKLKNEVEFGSYSGEFFHDQYSAFNLYHAKLEVSNETLFILGIYSAEQIIINE